MKLYPIKFTSTNIYMRHYIKPVAMQIFRYTGLLVLLRNSYVVVMANAYKGYYSR